MSENLSGANIDLNISLALIYEVFRKALLCRILKWGVIYFQGQKSSPSNFQVFTCFSSFFLNILLLQRCWRNNHPYINPITNHVFTNPREKWSRISPDLSFVENFLSSRIAGRLLYLVTSTLLPSYSLLFGQYCYERRLRDANISRAHLHRDSSTQWNYLRVWKGWNNLNSTEFLEVESKSEIMN